jgi:AhpD family alkylhydroperoxidase
VSAAARVAPGRARDLGALNWIACRAIALATGAGEARLFTTLARHRRLFRAWLLFASCLMPNGTLPRDETELVILRVARLRDCAYEIDHHVRLAQRGGVADWAIASALGDGADPRFAPRVKALLGAVDALVARRFGDDAWSLLAKHYDERRLIEICVLVGHYEMLATAIDALGIQRDFA